MKNFRTLFLTLGAIGLLGACSNEDVVENRPIDTNAVSFTSNIFFQEHPLSRVTENNWDANDAIGVYALKAGTALEDANIFDGKSNVKHTTKDAGKVAHFVAESNAIQLKTGDNIDVIGYYPHVATVANYTLPINVKDQSNLAKIDLLYSNNVKGVDVNGAANMKFTHQLSQISFVVEPGNGFPNVDGVKFGAIKGLKAEGSMNLKDGVVTLKEGAAVDLNVTANKAQGRVIVMPGQKLDKTVSMILTLDDKEFTWIPKKDYDLTSGKKYTFRLQLSADGSVITLNPSGEIVDWIEGNEDGGVDVITPGGEEPTDPEVPGDVTSIADFKEAYKGATFEQPVLIEKDITIRGIVMSDDTEKNIFNKLYIQDKTGAITLFVKNAELHKSFKVGQEVEIKVNGFYVTVFGDVAQVSDALKEGDRWKGMPIEWDKIESKITISNSAIKPIAPKVLSIDDFSKELINTLIQLDNVEFEDAGKPYTEDGKDTSRELKNADGKTVDLRNSGKSTFSKELLPTGKGSIVAFLDYFRGNYQLTIRDLNDVKFGGETPEPGKDVTVDKTALSFEKGAGEQTIALTADTDVAWTIENTDAWLTIAPKAGKGNQTITVTSEANTGKDRTGVITIKGGANDVVVNVSQAGDSEGEEVTIFEENFGVNDGKKLDVKFGSFDKYTEFSSLANGITVSNEGSRADIRARSSVMDYEKLAWMPAYKPEFPITDENPAPTVSFSGINLKNMTNIELTYDISANFSGNTANVNYVNVLIDGEKIDVPNIELTAADYGNKYYTVKINISKPFSKITFVTDERNDVGMRLDNIKVVATK